MNTTNANPASDTTTTTGISTTDSRPLQRPYRDRMLAGVAIGIADYLGIDVLIVRIALVVLTLIGGAGLPVYVAAWLLIPEEGASQSIASELLDSLWRHS